ncbi:MAG: HlyD family secretion protein [Chloroflexi bacterium]|nr:HlyD family secretion protein [Chloroflexota bacterium]
MQNHYNRRTVLIILTTLLLIGGFFLASWVIHNILYVSTDDAQVKGNLVGVSTKVAARVIRLGAEEGDMVEKGRVLAALDDRDLAATLAQAEASAQSIRLDMDRLSQDLPLQEKESDIRLGLADDSLASSGYRLDISQEDLSMQEETARAGLKRQEAALALAKTTLTKASAEYAEADHDADRAKQLFKQGGISQQEQEQAETRRIADKAGVDAAKESVKEQEHLLEVARAGLRTILIKQNQYLASKSDLESSSRNVNLARIGADRVNVSRQNLKILAAKLKEADAKVRYQTLMLAETSVKSPVTGSVARRNINMGEMTTPGSPLFYVLDYERIWVVANIQENNIRYVRPGDSVKVHLDAYPNKIFNGSVEFIGAAASSEFSLFPSDNPSGNFIKVTHRIPVRIKVDDSDHLLKPGMNAVVDISKKPPEKK